MPKYHRDTGWEKNNSSGRPLQLTYHGYIHVFHYTSGVFPAHSSEPRTQENEWRIQS